MPDAPRLLDPAEAGRLRDAIRRLAPPAPAPLVPEIILHQATEIAPIWEMTEAALAREGLGAPFWAFPWAGGQALARLILDRPALVAGRDVLALACGGGAEAIAAARAGAARVRANDIDPVALLAAGMNAALNGVALEPLPGDLAAAPPPAADLILAAEIFYERDAAARLLAWLKQAAAAGSEVLIADAGRGFLDAAGLERVAVHAVPVPAALEDRPTRIATVWRIPRLSPNRA